jgi:hypothetical protein
MNQQSIIYWFSVTYHTGRQTIPFNAKTDTARKDPQIFCKNLYFVLHLEALLVGSFNFLRALSMLQSRLTAQRLSRTRPARGPAAHIKGATRFSSVSARRRIRHFQIRASLVEQLLVLGWWTKALLVLSSVPPAGIIPGSSKTVKSLAQAKLFSVFLFINN